MSEGLGGSHRKTRAVSGAFWVFKLAPCTSQPSVRCIPIRTPRGRRREGGAAQKWCPGPASHTGTCPQHIQWAHSSLIGTSVPRTPEVLAISPNSPTTPT